MIDFISVGKKIARYRKDNQMTQDDLAEKLFVTRQLISKWENGCGVPTIDAIFELSKLFHVSFEELLCLDEEIEVDENDIFKGHDRFYIIKQLIDKKINLKIEDVLYQMSPSERMIILREIKEERLKVNINDLLPKLTPSEQNFLKKGGLNVYDFIKKSN